MSQSRCPLCKSKYTFVYAQTYDHRLKSPSRKDFLYRKCQSCSVVYLASETFNLAYYKRYYGPKYYLEKDGWFNKLEQAYCRLVDKHKVSIIRKVLPKKLKKYKLLEIGSGNGRFLKSLNQSRFERHGIDMAEIVPNTPKINRIRFYKGNILNMSFGKEKFDIIVMWHVLEHITSPHELFKKINGLLKKGGILVLSTPNINGLGAKLSKTSWYHFDAPRHVFLYNQKSLNTLALINGFTLTLFVNPFFDFPFDLIHSLPGFTKLLVLPIYPFLKFFSRETSIYAYKKK